jgi:hypothetical protein
MLGCVSCTLCMHLPAIQCASSHIAAPLARLDACLTQNHVCFVVCPAVTPPAGRCRLDADCGSSTLQCDTTQTLAYYTCANGLSTEHLFGACVAKPVRAEGTPQQLCNACLSTVRPFVDRAVNTTLAANTLATEFQTLCVANNYSMVTCSSVAAVIRADQPNLAKRAGALCMRMGQCSRAGGYTVSAVKRVTAAAPVVVAVVAASNDTNTNEEAPTAAVDSGPTTLAGALSACTIEGVVGGATVANTYSPAGMCGDSLLVVVDLAACAVTQAAQHRLLLAAHSP